MGVAWDTGYNYPSEFTRDQPNILVGFVLLSVYLFVSWSILPMTLTVYFRRKSIFYVVFLKRRKQTKIKKSRTWPSLDFDLIYFWFDKGHQIETPMVSITCNLPVTNTFHLYKIHKVITVQWSLCTSSFKPILFDIIMIFQELFEDNLNIIFDGCKRVVNTSKTVFYEINLKSIKVFG